MGRNGVKTRPLRRGDLVALRRPSEILESLDASGALDGVPFMPEMLRYFGGTFRVSARVERACDTIEQSGARRMPDTVMLDDLRCDGLGHGGCQAGCRLYWKEAWLRRVEDGHTETIEVDESYDRLRELAAPNTRQASDEGGRTVFRCQATEFLRATEPLKYWDARSFLREVTSGNVSPWRFVRVVASLLVNEPRRRRPRGGAPFQTAGNGVPESPSLHVQPGSRVKVRPREEIGETLDAEGKLRGLWFDREMLPYCGESATVKARVERFIDEGSGEMVELKTDCYILDGVVCRGYISDGRWFCCRGIYPWWREAWLELETDPRT